MFTIIPVTIYNVLLLCLASSLAEDDLFLNESAGVCSENDATGRMNSGSICYIVKVSLTITNSEEKIPVRVNHTEKLHFCFLTTKCYRIYSFPLKSIHLPEPAHKGSRNKAVSVIFIAFILNSCSSI